MLECNRAATKNQQLNMVLHKLPESQCNIKVQIIARVDEPLERLKNAKYIFTLDLTKEYWQIPLMAESQERQPSLPSLTYTNL